MTTIRDIMDFTESFAPLSTAADFDNCGLLVGSPLTSVSKVLLALDITPEVISEAADMGAELILSHHPVIFNPLRSLDTNSPAYLLASNGVAALCLHTNLDIAEDTGVNICLAEALKLENYTLHPENFLVVGSLEKEVSVREFAAFAKDALGAVSVEFTMGDKSVKTIALSSGAGASSFEKAAALGADLLLTGEAKHHEFLESKNSGIALMAAGHFATEDVVIAPLKEKLSKTFPEVSFIKSTALKAPTEAV